MPAGYPESDTVAEILGARRFLSDQCGIPADQIRGFRSPYLVTNPVVRKVRLGLQWRVGQGDVVGGKGRSGLLAAYVTDRIPHYLRRSWNSAHPMPASQPLFVLGAVGERLPV